MIANDGSSGRLSIDSVTHRYGKAVALSDVSLEVQSGEFITFLGPSGCGKTTLLRIVAGFVRPSQGRVVLDGSDITRLRPNQRAVNMVFQRPMMFPHLDVFENVAFGLRIARLGKTEIKERVSAALELVRLEGFERRRATELSGGQMQRISLARALVNRPRVLLLDEPLSALDLKIRLDMQAELRRVHRETGATFLYVTHDQGEALALSDRVVVFSNGRIEQVGSPTEIYQNPASTFAAQFVGDANVVPITIEAVTDGEADVALNSRRFTVRTTIAEPGPAWLVVRAEAMQISAPAGADDLSGTVVDIAFRGSGYSLQVDVPGIETPLKADMPVGLGARFNVGDTVAIGWDSGAASLIREAPC